MADETKQDAGDGVAKKPDGQANSPAVDPGSGDKAAASGTPGSQGASSPGTGEEGGGVGQEEPETVPGVFTDGTTTYHFDEAAGDYVDVVAGYPDEDQREAARLRRERWHCTDSEYDLHGYF